MSGKSPRPPEVFEQTQDLGETSDLTATAPNVVPPRMPAEAREEVWSIVRAALDEANRPDSFRKETDERLAKLEGQLTKLQADIDRLSRAAPAGAKAPSLPPPPARPPSVAPPPARQTAALGPLPPPTFVKDIGAQAPAPSPPPPPALPPPPPALPTAKQTAAIDDADTTVVDKEKPPLPAAAAPAAAASKAAAPAKPVSMWPSVSVPPKRQPSVADWEAAAGSLDIAELGFDGGKRRKRLGLFIGLLLVALVASSVIVAIVSQSGAH